MTGIVEYYYIISKKIESMDRRKSISSRRFSKSIFYINTKMFKRVPWFVKKGGSLVYKKSVSTPNIGYMNFLREPYSIHLEKEENQGRFDSLITKVNYIDGHMLVR